MTSTRSGSTGIDPDRLVELELERDHLLRSLADLDAERDAGDLSDADYATLNDDYTHRAARVIREIDTHERESRAVRPPISWSRRAMTIGGIAAVATIAGVLLALSSGFRSPSGEVTGDIRRSSAGLLAEADTLTREGDWAGAVEVYDEVLDLSPSNAEALTYRGWLTSRLGDDETGLIYVLDAVEVDPSFPDARVFAAALLQSEARFDEAAAQLKALDSAEVPPQIQQLIDQFGLRGSIVAGQLAQRFGDGEPIDLAGLDAPVDDLTSGALSLYTSDPVTATRVFDAVLEIDPDNLTALLTNGNTLASDPTIAASSPDVAAIGVRYLDRAVAVAPDLAEARLARARARVVQGDVAGAAEDLALIDVAELPEELLAIYDQVLLATN